MEIIIDIFNEVIKDEYLPLLVVFVLVVMALMLLNILLGTIYGTKEEKFDFKKHLFGWLKMLATGIVIIAFGFVVDYFVIALNHLPQIAISTELITIGEILAVIVVWCVDLTKEIIEKVKSLKELKYITYDNVKINKENPSLENAIRG